MRGLLLTLVICCLVAVEVAADPPAGDTPPTGNRYSLHQLRNGTLLLDGQTGETWMLMPDASAWKQMARIVPPPTGTSLPSDADSTSEISKPIPYELVPLLLEEQLLLEKYGEGHPYVREKRKLIETVRNLMSGKSADGQGVLSAIDHHEKLLPLLIEEQLILYQYGPEHPRAISIRKQIELTRSFRKDAAKPKPAE